VLFPLNELDTDQKVELWRDLVAIEEVRLFFLVQLF